MNKLFVLKVKNLEYNKFWNSLCFKIINTLLIIIVIFNFSCASSVKHKNFKLNEKQSLKNLKKSILGEWKSICVEIRPLDLKRVENDINQINIKRNYNFFGNDNFLGSTTLFSDKHGKKALYKIIYEGKVVWVGRNSVLKGSWKVNLCYENIFFEPFDDKIANALNIDKKKYNVKLFPNIFKSYKQTLLRPEYEIFFIKNDMLFMGAKNIDGSSIEKEEDRPVNLGLPLIKVIK